MLETGLFSHSACHLIFMYYISYYNVYLLVVVVLLVQKNRLSSTKKYVFVFHLQCSVPLVRPCTLKSRGETALFDSLGDLTTILYWFDTMKTENLILKFKLCYGKWYLLATFYYYNRRLWNYVNDWGVEMQAFCKWNFKSSKKNKHAKLLTLIGISIWWTILNRKICLFEWILHCLEEHMRFAILQDFIQGLNLFLHFYLQSNFMPFENIWNCLSPCMPIDAIFVTNVYR